MLIKWLFLSQQYFKWLFGNLILYSILLKLSHSDNKYLFFYHSLTISALFTPLISLVTYVLDIKKTIFNNMPFNYIKYNCNTETFYVIQIFSVNFKVPTIKLI